MAAGAFPYKSVRWDILLGRTYLTSFSRLYVGRAKVPLHEIPNELFDSPKRIPGPSEGMHDLSQQFPRRGRILLGITSICMFSSSYGLVAREQEVLAPEFGHFAPVEALLALWRPARTRVGSGQGA